MYIPPAVCVILRAEHYHVRNANMIYRSVLTEESSLVESELLFYVLHFRVVAGRAAYLKPIPYTNSNRRVEIEPVKSTDGYIFLPVCRYIGVFIPHLRTL